MELLALALLFPWSLVGLLLVWIAKLKRGASRSHGVEESQTPVNSDSRPTGANEDPSTVAPESRPYPPIKAKDLRDLYSRLEAPSGTAPFTVNTEPWDSGLRLFGFPVFWDPSLERDVVEVRTARGTTAFVDICSCEGSVHGGRCVP